MEPPRATGAVRLKSGDRTHATARISEGPAGLTARPFAERPKRSAATQWAGGAANTPARGLRVRGAKAMSTSTSSSGARQGQPRPKPARTISLCVRPAEGASGVVRISVGHAAQDYILTVVPADLGRGFLLEKVG